MGIFPPLENSFTYKVCSCLCTHVQKCNLSSTQMGKLGVADEFSAISTVCSGRGTQEHNKLHSPL